MRSSLVVILVEEMTERRRREGGDPGSGGANTSGDSGADRPGNPTGHHRWGDGSVERGRSEPKSRGAREWRCHSGH